MAPPVVHPAHVMQPGYYGDQPNGICNVTPEEFLRAFETFHRHTCTHSQMTTPAQYRRMAAPGACANVFANHIWAWGDQHLDLTVGPDCARRNNAAATALRCGVPISLHSDSPGPRSGCCTPSSTRSRAVPSPAA